MQRKLKQAVARLSRRRSTKRRRRANIRGTQGAVDERDSVGSGGHRARIGLSVTFVDAAGNSTARAFSINYTLVGAPVVAVLDSNFASYGDTASIYPYTTTSNYPALIGTYKRVLRWVVYNPNQEAVWTSIAQASFSGSWVEQWYESAGIGTGGGVTLSDLGQSSPDYMQWYSRIYNANWEATADECSVYPTSSPQFVDRRGPFPCARSTQAFASLWADPQPVHYYGEASPFTRCETPRTGVYNGTAFGSAYPTMNNSLSLASGLTVLANPLPTGKEPGAAPPVTFNGNSGWSIPAASANTAAGVAVYVFVGTPVRAAGVAAAVLPLSGTGQQRFRAGWRYNWVDTDVSLACHVCRGFGCLTFNQNYYNQGWVAEYFDRYLNSHTVNVAGALTLKTNPDAVTSGTSFSNWANIPYSYSATR